MNNYILCLKRGASVIFGITP